MKILGIDTSTSYAGVGLSVDGSVSSETWQSRHNHGREVMPAVMRLLDAENVTVADLDVVAVALGPGGFSAVRVGIATAQGLVAPTNATLVGAPTHLIQAYRHRDFVGKQIVSIIPVGRNQVSYAVFKAPLTGTSEEFESGIIDEDQIEMRFGGNDVAICGETTTSASIQPRSPEDLVAIAIERFERGVVSIGPVEPIYSRPPTITAPRRS